MLNTSSDHVWNLTVKSSSPINENIFNQQIFSEFKLSNLPDSSAQIAVEIIFNSPKELSRIRITPNVSDSLDLIQIIVESNKLTGSSTSTNSSNKYSVLGRSVKIKNAIDIDLPASDFVNSLIIVFGQKNYIRTNVTPIQSEVNAKLVNSISAAIRSAKKSEHDRLQDTVIKYFLKDYATDYIIRNKKLYNYDYTDYYPTDYEKLNVGAIEEFKSKNLFSDIDDINKFKNTTILSNIVFSLVSFSLGSKLRSVLSRTYIESNIKDSVKNVSNYSSGGIIPLSDSNKSENNIHYSENLADHSGSIDLDQVFSNIEKSGKYEYIFSIKNIAMFSKSSTQTTSLPVPLSRSVFVSKKTPIDGLPMRVKMMADYFSEVQYSEDDLSQDKTSIEFSVSIKDNPIMEEDWISIIPFGDSSIRTEILYPDSSGNALLRFNPNEESVRLYEDSTRRDFGSFLVNGKNIKVLNFNSNKKYFVSYSLSNINVSKEIQLFSKSMTNPVLINASFDGFGGERFESTNIDKSIELSYTPYISQEKLVNSIYSSINGTITTNKSSFGNFDYSSYSPVKIIFEDGSSAINLTNYINSSTQVPNFYSETLNLFVHSANKIVFNKYIDSPFRVIYQYIPSIFRYRVVLRSLNNSSENYSVDRLLFKFSIDKENSMENNFLKYDNKYKNKLI